MTRLESIRNNTFLLGLDMNRATKEQKTQWLCQMIDNETDKPEDEMDFALIGECSAYLRELSDKAAEATKEQKQRILQQIKAHHNQTATKTAKILRPSWKTTRKVIVFAIAAALALLSTLTVIAKVKGYSNAWEYVKENAQKFLNMNAGDTVTNGNVTLIKGEESISYSSIEELLKIEGYDILYPTTLPEGIQIANVSLQVVNENYIIYSIQFTDSNMAIMISSNFNIPEDDLEKHTILSTPKMTFYIKEVSSGIYQAVGYDGKYGYIISANNYDYLTTILEGMGDLEK